MSNRLEILANGMTPLAKWGCGTVFMASILFIVWVVASYTYHIFWVTNVGRQEYKELSLELPRIEGRFQETTPKEEFLALKQEVDQLKQINATLATKTELQNSNQIQFSAFQQRLDLLHNEIAALHSNVAVVNSQNFITVTQANENAELRALHEQQQDEKLRQIDTFREELAILRAAFARFVDRDR